MSIIYMTEDEQIAMIKTWFKRHQRVLVSLIAVVLFGVIGGRYWLAHLEQLQTNASVTYGKLMDAVAREDVASTEAYAHALISNAAKPIYVDSAHLMLARSYVERSQWNEARSELQAVIDSSKHAGLKALALMRLARIFVFEKRMEDAFKTAQQLEGDASLKKMIDLTQLDALKREINRGMERANV